MRYVVAHSCLLLAAIAIASAQANVDTSKKDRLATGTGCPSTAQVLPDGSVQITNCAGSRRFAASATNQPAANTPKSSVPVARGIVDPSTEHAHQEALRTTYEYQTFSYKHAMRSFDWQYTSGKVIFWLIVLLVLAGLLFAGVQFYMGYKHPLEGGDGEQTSDSELEATLQGIKLKSSVLGLLILTLSMAFFYMYLKFVYPITNISK